MQIIAVIKRNFWNGYLIKNNHIFNFPAITDYVFNDFLQLTAESSIPGSLLFLFLLIYVACKNRQKIKKRKTETRSAAFTGSPAILLVILIAGMTAYLIGPDNHLICLLHLPYRYNSKIPTGNTNYLNTKKLPKYKKKYPKYKTEQFIPRFTGILFYYWK